MASHRRAPRHPARRRATWRVLLGIVTAANLALGITVLATGPGLPVTVPTDTAAGTTALVDAGAPVVAAPAPAPAPAGR